ncbi:MAG: competence/damage-inducible protein A [Armatimonadota bacterium]|nr:competence/damage-inducible protein A [Armatimonadota bacterium]MDR7400731.1 competence/damage-inducible protein A [Armatimonadota bacterium]MDR7405040.1 competence/damage-inducible protein A [Armatimonadota bacterium]MDR7436458.1 competence/damage-inducible protein A [Armatimonadota bacterium]MDR7472493.1 competence/damage-inducible protein A [Armatimonadota bacterium]
MRAEIISVGTELLLGQIVDTNAAYLGQRLAEVGVDVHCRQTVGDNPARIREALRLALSRADLVVMTGGLGPTEDDLTVEAVAAALGRELVRDPEVAEHIRRFFASRGRTPPETVYKQALVPRGAQVIPNARGTAPGIHLQDDGRDIVIMPGVPYEMQGMVESYLLPLLRQRTGGIVIRSRVLRVTGEGESAVEARIKDLLSATQPTIAPYAKLGEVHLRLTAKGRPEDVAAALDRGEALVRERLGDLVYGTDDQTLEAVTASLLTARGVTVAVAESCTGGLVSQRLTSVPGSSAYFLLGVVAYSNDAKVRDLGVDPGMLRRHGAVSAEVAEAMASAVRARAGATLGVGLTGIAGPTGGTPDKPVGLVFLSLAHPEGVDTRRLQLGAEAGREGIRFLASQAALNALRLHLLRR